MHLVLFLALALLVVFPRSAHAYIDPGSGSMMLQVLLGGVAAAFVSIRLFWARLVGRIRARSGPDQAAADEMRER